MANHLSRVESAGSGTPTLPRLPGTALALQMAGFASRQAFE
jgi:hypothetical protein